MTNKKSITDKVLERIEHTTPRSRTYFWIRNAGMWALAGASIVVGALALSSTMFRAINAGITLRPGSVPPVATMLHVVPFLWIILITAFGYLAYREIRSTRRGYTYEFSTLILGTILASCALGIVFYITGAGFVLDKTAARYLSFHTDLERVQRDRWLQPEQGFLVGAVRERTAEGVTLTDPAQVTWSVSFAETISQESIAALTEGQRVGVRGQLLNANEHTFLACDIRSLEFEGRGPLHRLPPPPFRPHAQDERNIPAPRSNECEDVRPLGY